MHSDAETTRDGEIVRAYIGKTFRASLRAPAGALAFPYVDPGAGYDGILWDWDAYFCLVGLAGWGRDVAAAAAGCVRNFLAFQAADGSIPYCLIPGRGKAAADRPAAAPANSAKPLLAQFTRLAVAYGADDTLSAEAYPALARHCAHWETTQLSLQGLFTFRSHRGSGTDDHPAVYRRPFNSSADVFLNCLMVREYVAMADIAATLGHADDACDWRAKAATLSARIVARMWDPIDGMYYNLDVGSADVGKVNQPVTWPVPLKFRSWTGVMPLWAGIAPPAQAERVIREHLLNPDELRSPHGIRSLARNEPAYELAVGSNPSCWRGPIWIVANYLAWCALRQYGCDPEAAALAADVAAMMARDVTRNGCLHEYYRPDTGEGLTHPGFLNWNTLILLMIEPPGGRRPGERGDAEPPAHPT